MKFIGTQTIKNNKGIVANIIAAFGIKGLGLIMNMLSMPLYMDYFDNNLVLGLWFTILTVLNWILSFDVGIGNGLRNHLTKALAQKNYEEGKQLTSSAFASLGLITLLFTLVVFGFLPHIDWNSVFNISSGIVSTNTLEKCVSITMVGIMVSFFLNIVRGILYALQLSSIVNLLHLLTSILLVVYLFVATEQGAIDAKLESISTAYATIINIPYLFALIYVFLFSEMKHCRPKLNAISKNATKNVMGLGITFFICQIMYMVITVTNEWFISKFFSPEHCVDYQIYFRLFSLVGSLIMLAMSPLWSAITKAYTQKRYHWIIKLQKVLYYIAFISIIAECLLIVFMQPLINFWLGERAIEVNYYIAAYFLLYGVIMIWVTIQSTIVAGLGTLNTQLRFYLFAAIFKIVFIIIAAQFSANWEIVILITSIGLLPYCFYQPMVIKKELKTLELQLKN